MTGITQKGWIASLPLWFFNQVEARKGMQNYSNGSKQKKQKTQAKTKTKQKQETNEKTEPKGYSNPQVWYSFLWNCAKQLKV